MENEKAPDKELSVITRKVLGIIATAALLQGSAAQASIIGTLSFVEPTGTVAADEPISVWVRLTLSADSDPLVYYSAVPFPNGFDAADMPLEGRNRETGEVAQFDSYSFITPFVSRGCDDTFTVGCSDPGSQYEFSTASANGWFDFDGTIGPHQSMDFELYTLTPLDGLAETGNYDLFTAAIGFFVFGLDADGNELISEVLRVGTDCAGPECTFSRTVAPVPIPAATWLLVSGLLGLFGATGRRISAA